MAKISTIRLSERTKARLRALRVSPGESYENVILRLLETKIGAEQAEYVLYKEDCDNCWVKLVIDWNAPDKSIEFLSRDGVLVSGVPLYNFEDAGVQLAWNMFKEDVEDLDNLYSMCAILDEGQILHLGDICLRRL